MVWYNNVQTIDQMDKSQGDKGTCEGWEAMKPMMQVIGPGVEECTVQVTVGLCGCKTYGSYKPDLGC